MEKFRVYIIYSVSADRYYVGYTSDLDKRIEDHRSGISTYTSKTSDWQIRYSELYNSRADALKREREIKKRKSRKYIEWLIASDG